MTQVNQKVVWKFVSILTHSEEQVLLDETAAQVGAVMVSILTHSEEQVLPRRRRASRCCLTCFNPHPLRRAGATG